MSPCLVDSNVLLDIATVDPIWFSWSSKTLIRLANSSSLVINSVIYAEVSVRFSTIEELDNVLPLSMISREPIPFEAAFLAGKCFQMYRQNGGIRTSTLPDFFIGAHAAISGFHLLTRDVARYRSYFPNLTLITPDSNP